MRNTAGEANTMKSFLIALGLILLAVMITAVMRTYGYAQVLDAPQQSFLQQLLQTGVVIAVIGSIVAVLVKHWFSAFLRKRLEKLEGASKTRLEVLLSHPFFDRITDAARTADGMDIGLATPVLREMLRIKFRWWGDGMRKFVSDPTMAKADVRQLIQYNTATLDAIISGYETEWLQMGIPSSIISEFNKWHTPQARVAIDAAKDSITAASRETNRQRLEGILDAHNYLILDTLHDCENALKNLGENDKDSLIEYMKGRGYIK